MKATIVLMLACPVLLTGCASMRAVFVNPTAPFPKLNAYAKLIASNPQATADQRTSAAGEDFQEAIVFCRSVLNHYERGGKKAASTKIAIGAIGSIAGGIVAPSLAAGGAAMSAIAGWSGLSGVTNSLLTDFGKSSIDEDFYFQERRNVAKALKSSITRISAETDAAKKVEFSRELAATCIATDISGAATEAPAPAPGPELAPAPAPPAAGAGGAR
jgi:hypothetical protein